MDKLYFNIRNIFSISNFLNWQHFPSWSNLTGDFSMNFYALFMGKNASNNILSAKSQSKSIVPFYEFIRELELAPNFLGLQMILAMSFARIHL